MTALEAYALAKRIASSAVSGIASYSISGTTLIMTTNDGQVLTMTFPTPKDGLGIKSTTIDANGHLIITYDDDTTEDAGELPGADVNVTQILTSGTKIAEIEVDGIKTDIFAPSGGGGGTAGSIYTGTLLASEWDSITKQQTVTFTNYSAAYNGVIGLPADATSAQMEEYKNCVIRTVSQSGATVTFECEEIPSINLPVEIYCGGGSGGGPAVLTDDLTAAVTVGGITVGTQYEEGESLETILRDMLDPVMYPILTSPSATISATGAKLLETGATLNTVFTVTFNRGSINPAYGTSGYRSGAATGYSLNGGDAQSENTFSRTITSEQLTYRGTVEYGAGEQPKDSSGKDYSTPLAAGSVNTNTITYEFVDALWANTSNIATIAKLALVSKGAKQKDFTFPAQTVANPEVFDVPASWTVTAIQVKNDLSGAYEDAIDQFAVTNVTHNDAAGNAVNYKRYTFNLGYDTGSRNVRLKWS